MNSTVVTLKIIAIIFIAGMLNTFLGQTRFAIIGDFGNNSADELAVSILVKSWDPDFIITTGDNSYGDTPIDDNIGQYYQEYIYPYVGSYGSGSPDSTNRFWVTLGNHDYSDGLGINAHYAYFELPNNERYYDLVIDNVHLFMVNSNTQEPDSATATYVQANWIQSKMVDCVANHLHWKVVAFHHPPYSSGQHQSSTYMRWPFESWGAHFVVSGHEHSYERLEVNGFPYFVNGSGGRPLRPFGAIHSASVVRDAAHFGAQLVTISNDSCYIDFYGVDNVKYDSLIIVDSALPVELSSFSASVLENRVKLNWRTETEVSNYGFEVQRAHTSTPLSVTDWDVLGFVEGHGNSNSPKDYSFTDNLTFTPNLTLTLYYRLKQIDTDGKFEYSKIVEVDLETPRSFELEQNYPNPFNPVTTINFSLPENSFVNLSVYNILGEKVVTLLNENKDAGFHSINFTAVELNSGIYFYNIEAGDFVQSRKMILLK